MRTAKSSSFGTAKHCMSTMDSTMQLPTMQQQFPLWNPSFKVHPEVTLFQAGVEDAKVKCLAERAEAEADATARVAIVTAVLT